MTSVTEHTYDSWRMPERSSGTGTDRGHRGYLNAHVARHGHARTAKAFGVSRHTLWRFLERGQPGRTLPRAVTDRVGDTPGKLAAATRALAGESRLAPSQRPPPLFLRHGLRRALRALCETPFATVDELSRTRQVPASTLRGRLARLRERGLADGSGLA